MSNFIRIGTKVVVSRAGQPDIEGVVRDLYGRHGRHTKPKDKTPPYYVEYKGGDGWFDADEVTRASGRGGRVPRLTSFEESLLKAFPRSNYGSEPEWHTWVFEVLTKSGIEASQARGVLSSLIKKGLVVVETNTDPREPACYLTDKGIRALSLI